MRDIVNTSGTVIDHVVYDSYGNIVTETNASNGDRFKFAGMEYDSVTGQYYDRARYYNPTTGRFASEDPLGFRGGDADLFAYAFNSPADFTDSTGEDAIYSGGANPPGYAYGGYGPNQDDPEPGQGGSQPGKGDGQGGGSQKGGGGQKGGGQHPAPGGGPGPGPGGGFKTPRSGGGAPDPNKYAEYKKAIDAMDAKNLMRQMKMWPGRQPFQDPAYWELYLQCQNATTLQYRAYAAAEEKMQALEWERYKEFYNTTHRFSPPTGNFPPNPNPPKAPRRQPQRPPRNRAGN